ncbi:DUF1707 domain-containing protein [Micromonospora zingiberis]|uniref:DUF1707 domain-containing protein n=1 Tax=Micromonospora zingiberis TaxID=2053011 RepID=A0A4R0GUP9_9ACTN|nr:DUF1707 domain-containing protein [Micromonospora zingiberis]
MRAADADRQVVAERLRVALDEGRLDLHEYDERLQGAYAARTYAELDALVGDLPAAGALAPTAGVAPTQRSGGVPAERTGAEPAPALSAGGRGVTARWLAEVWEPWLRVVGILVAIWAVTSLAAGELLYFWPGWVAGPWGAVVLVGTISGLASGEPQRSAAQQERRRQRRAEKKALKRERKARRDQGEVGPAEATEGSAAGGGSGVRAGDDRGVPEGMDGRAEVPGREGDADYQAAEPGLAEQRRYPDRDA